MTNPKAQAPRTCCNTPAHKAHAHDCPVWTAVKQRSTSAKVAPALHPVHRCCGTPWDAPHTADCAVWAAIRPGHRCMPLDPPPDAVDWEWVCPECHTTWHARLVGDPRILYSRPQWEWRKGTPWPQHKHPATAHCPVTYCRATPGAACRDMLGNMLGYSHTERDKVANPHEHEQHEHEQHEHIPVQQPTQPQQEPRKQRSTLRTTPPEGYGVSKFTEVHSPDLPGSVFHPPAEVNAKTRASAALVGFGAGLVVMWCCLRRFGGTLQV